MTQPESGIDNKAYILRAIETSVRLGLLFLLLAWCFLIIEPFFAILIWGIIIAVAIHPLFVKFETSLGGRRKLAATLYTLIAIALLITPTLMITGSIIETSEEVSAHYKAGTLQIPAPHDDVKDWPLIGNKVHSLWSRASQNLKATLKAYSTQVKQVGGVLFDAVAGAGITVLQFLASLIISGVLLAQSRASYELSVKLFRRLAGEKQGLEYVHLTSATIRSVAQGVLGVAIIQALAAALGMYLMDVPAWGLWTILVLVLAVAQLPPLVVLLPVALYVFSVADTTPAVIFMIWSLLVSLSDGLLKPLFLGRGMETPTLVILIGAIGGMILSGIIGLFVGAIVLALSYELFMAWLNNNQPEQAVDESENGQATPAEPVA